MQDPAYRVLLAAQEIHLTLPLESKSVEQSKHPKDEQDMQAELVVVLTRKYVWAHALQALEAEHRAQLEMLT